MVRSFRRAGLDRQSAAVDPLHDLDLAVADDLVFAAAKVLSSHSTKKVEWPEPPNADCRTRSWPMPASSQISKSRAGAGSSSPRQRCSEPMGRPPCCRSAPSRSRLSQRAKLRLRSCCSFSEPTNIPLKKALVSARLGREQRLVLMVVELTVVERDGAAAVGAGRHRPLDAADREGGFGDAALLESPPQVVEGRDPGKAQ